MAESKKVKVLKFIGSVKGGARFTDIQRFIVEHNGYNYDEMEPVLDYDRATDSFVNRGKMQRRYRGYWCVNLYGGGMMGYPYNDGLLKKYCDRKGRLYVLNKLGRAEIKKAA